MKCFACGFLLLFRIFYRCSFFTDSLFMCTILYSVHMAKNVLLMLRACTKLDLVVFFRLWLIFTLCLCSLFDHTSREVYNAFIIGCLYSNVSVCVCFFFAIRICFPSNNQVIICNSTNVLL